MIGEGSEGATPTQMAIGRITNDHALRVDAAVAVDFGISMFYDYWE